MSQFRIDDFSGGRDKRPRLFYGKEKNRFRELDNAFVGKDRKIHSRWPLRFVEGTVSIGATGFGAISINGTLTYFASKTVAPSVSIPGVTTGVLQFDELPGHLADGIVKAEIFFGYVVALLRHRFYDSAGVATNSYTYKLHVFDGADNKPTYVEDPGFPTSWGPTLPLHLYRTGVLGAEVQYTPRMGLAAGKVYVSSPKGDVNFCSPTNARVWNMRTQVQLTNEGEWYYWNNYETFAAGTLVDTTATAGASATGRWIISENAGLLNLFGGPQGWTCYVLEYCDTSGMWHQLIEDAYGGPAPSVNGHYQVKATTPRFTHFEYGFVIKMPADATPIFRHRLIAGSPPIVVTSGGVWSDNQTRSAASYTFEGVAGYSPAPSGIPAPTDNYSRFLLLNVATPSSAQYIDTHAAVPTPVFPNVAFTQLTGYQRYTSLVLGWGYEYDNGTSTEFHTELTSFLAYTVDVSQRNDGYSFITGNATPFYADRLATATANAGFEVAGFLATSTRAKIDGGPVTALSVMRDYLGIHYRSLTLLYALNSNQLLDTVRDQSYFGTGDYTDGVTTAFYHQSILLSERGFRAFSVGQSATSDRADDNNIGEANEQFDPATTQLLNACFWPYTGQYIAILRVSSVDYLYVFDYSKDSKISAWSRWRIGATPDCPGPNGLIPIGTRLYLILSTGGVAYLDAAPAAGQWFDDLGLDGVGAVGGYSYPRVAECYYNDFGSSDMFHQIMAMELVVQGATTVSFKVLSSSNERTVPGPTIAGTTIGGKRVLLAMRANAVAPRFLSIARDEWILDSYAVDFRSIKR